ncbi:MAG: hypothetical protein EOP45_04030 [Sphingobacteriaceae bacterium]|nr:MAG: hypothetical protein EOP45_04030 [Sphingobacteriaceae bacterium]
MDNYLSKQISSKVFINSSIDNIWDKITNVEIEEFNFPWYFRFLNIPKPIRAKILEEGIGGKRMAYFDNHKTFIQEIITWEKNKTYSFTFNSEDTFRAGYFFNIFKGIFSISKGTYYITVVDNHNQIELETDYFIRKGFGWILNKPIYMILTLFQGYLLNTIKITSES